MYVITYYSVTQSNLTLCDPKDCTTPGFPVHHYLLKFIKTHVHWIGDAIQPSQTLSPPSPPAFNLSQHQGLFQFNSLQSLSCVWLSATPWTAAHQTSLSITNSQSLLKLVSVESVMPCNHLILCPLLLLPSIFPSIQVFSNESALRIRWPKY